MEKKQKIVEYLTKYDGSDEEKKKEPYLEERIKELEKRLAEFEEATDDELGSIASRLSKSGSEEAVEYIGRQKAASDYAASIYNKE